MEEDDGWVSAAMSNDLLVANLLLQLRHDTLPAPPRSTKLASSVPNLRWSMHRPRSATRHPQDPMKMRSESTKKPAPTAGKKGESEPVSPDTPLLWNGSTCTDGAVAASDGRDDNPVDSSRPKVGGQSETATAKRSRRKRTLAELKGEESLLLKQRTDLQNECASLRLTVEKHRATNESLKRMKLNMESRHIIKIGAGSMVSEKVVLDIPQLAETPCHPSESVSTQTVKENKVLDDAANASSKPQGISSQQPLFLLPDLNLPAGEDFDSQF